MAITAGYDVGGAHLKVALAEDGRIVAVEADRLPAVARHGPARRRPCRGRRARRPRRAARCNHDRRTVRTVPRPANRRAEILDRLAAELDAELRIWMGLRGFAVPGSAIAEPASVGSTNFLASADTRRAQRCPTRCSSTWARRRPTSYPSSAASRSRAASRTASGCDRRAGLQRPDADRGERCRARDTFKGRQQRLAAGGFANMADVRRILGELPDGVDQHDTPTGAASRSRRAWRGLRAASAAMPAMQHRGLAQAARNIADRRCPTSAARRRCLGGSAA